MSFVISWNNAVNDEFCRNNLMIAGASKIYEIKSDHHNAIIGSCAQNKLAAECGDYIQLMDPDVIFTPNLFRTKKDALNVAHKFIAGDIDGGIALAKRLFGFDPQTKTILVKRNKKSSNNNQNRNRNRNRNQAQNRNNVDDNNNNNNNNNNSGPLRRSARVRQRLVDDNQPQSLYDDDEKETILWENIDMFIKEKYHKIPQNFFQILSQEIDFIIVEENNMINDNTYESDVNWLNRLSRLVNECINPAYESMQTISYKVKREIINTNTATIFEDMKLQWTHIIESAFKNKSNENISIICASNIICFRLTLHWLLQNHDGMVSINDFNSNEVLKNILNFRQAKETEYLTFSRAIWKCFALNKELIHVNVKVCYFRSNSRYKTVTAAKYYKKMKQLKDMNDDRRKRYLQKYKAFKKVIR